MRAFQLEDTTELTLKSVHYSKIKHGTELVQAVYLNFLREGSNDILNVIDEALRHFHYCNLAELAGQEPLTETLRVLPDLRMPKLNGQKFKYGGDDMYQGYRCEIDYGLGGESNIDFTGASAGKHKYETLEGGTVKHEFQVSYWGDSLTDEVVARLLKMERQKVFIKLLAPSVLTLVKGGKAPKAADPEDDEQLDIIGDGEEEPDGDDSPEAAFTAAHAG